VIWNHESALSTLLLRASARVRATGQTPSDGQGAIDARAALLGGAFGRRLALDSGLAGAGGCRAISQVCGGHDLAASRGGTVRGRACGCSIRSTFMRCGVVQHDVHTTRFWWPPAATHSRKQQSTFGWAGPPGRRTLRRRHLRWRSFRVAGLAQPGRSSLVVGRAGLARITCCGPASRWVERAAGRKEL